MKYAKQLFNTLSLEGKTVSDHTVKDYLVRTYRMTDKDLEMMWVVLDATEGSANYIRVFNQLVGELVFKENVKTFLKS